MYYGEAGDHFPGPNASNGSVATCFGQFLTFLVPISLWSTHSVPLWNTHRACAGRAGPGWAGPGRGGFAESLGMLLPPSTLTLTHTHTPKIATPPLRGDKGKGRERGADTVDGENEEGGPPDP